MNILYLHCHDAGRYIQPYGYAVPTPHLQWLAEQSVLFRKAFSVSPSCSPSRSGLLSGMTPHSLGMFGLVNRGFAWRDLDYSKHLSVYFRENGYTTALCGVQHEAPQTKLLGYELDFNKESPYPRHKLEHDIHQANCAAAFLKQKHDKPFFLAVGFFAPHREYEPIAKEIDPGYVMPPFPFYDSPQTRQDMAAFISSATQMDRCIGIVLDAVRASGRWNDTLIVFTTDHGLAMPRMKCNLLDTGIGVALMVRIPGRESAEVSDALVSQLDIFPTLCDVAGLEKPNWLQGHSMMPLLEGNVDRVREELFAEVSYHCGYEPMRAVRTDRYKLIRFFDSHNELVLANIDDSPTKQFMLDHGYAEETRMHEMLYDLYLDPVERDNRVSDPRYRGIHEELSERLDLWMMETEDPLREGPIPKDPGARVNKRSCISPWQEDWED